MLILFLLVGAALLGVGGVFWFWFRTLHDEAGPALVATVFSVLAFLVLTAVFAMLQRPLSQDESFARDQRPRHAMVLAPPVSIELVAHL